MPNLVIPNVYAIALDNKNQTKEAIKVLVKANKRWPNQYDLLMTLVLYTEKAGNKKSIYKYLSALTAIAPNAPDIKQLVKNIAVEKQAQQNYRAKVALKGRDKSQKHPLDRPLTG